MAYAAVVSLIQILKQLMLSDQISIPYPKSQIESLHTKLCSLQAVIEKVTINDFETQIRDAMYEAEDIVESHISSHLLPSEYGSSREEIFSQKLQKFLQEFVYIEEETANMADRLRQESDLMPVASSTSAATVKRKFVGLKDSLLQLRAQIIGETSRLKVVAVVGMAGVGKTNLVKEVYDDPTIGQFFPYRAWARVGSNYHRRDILLALLMSAVLDVPNLHQEISDVQLTEYVYKNLKGRRYLIVLDDLCDMRTWDDLKGLFPDDDNGSRIMVTTRLRKVANYAAGTARNIHPIRFLDKEESWDVLRDIVFARESCPSNLLKVGKTIAENCQGLPLTIVLVSSILSCGEKTLEYWKKLADSQTSAVFDEHDDVYSTTSVMQFLNDEHLPQHLKACFLYMGVFPMNYEVPASRLIQLWVAEGFLEPKQHKTMEKVAEDCLEELVDRSLILVHEGKCTSGIKTCSVHSAVWQLCVNAAQKENFFRAFNRYTGGPFPEGSNRGRRLCVRKNILFAIKDVYSSIESVSTARSLLCIGPNHTHPLCVCLNFRFLRVLEALTIRFYEFPSEIPKLVQLRYLALTFNQGEIPASVSKLWNLQFLIVCRHLSINSSGAPSYLPLEIWNMKQLRHLQVMGCDLIDPSSDALLPNLFTLSDVGSHSCTKGVLERTPNLKKLGILIDLVDDGASPLCLFDQLERLKELESFKCVIMNPDQESQVVARPDPVSKFPSTLKKLTLSGCGLPWDDMKIFTQGLPNLEVLKLRCYAFQGPKWELDDEEFIRLKFLLLEDMDIEEWIAHGEILPGLRCLVIRHCYKLQEIPPGVEYITTLQKVEVVDCSPSVVESALRIKEMQEDLSNDDLQFRVESSWNERPKRTDR